MNRPIPSTLSVRVPFAVRRRGGRKLVITPDGETHRPRPRVDRALVKALARAHRWQRILESGECASITELAVAEKIGCSAEALRSWVRWAEVDSGRREGVTTAERTRLRELEREVRELRQANEILRKASAYFAQAELDRRAG